MTETLVTLLAAQMEECDPLAEIRIDLDCPACGYHWQILFDIASYFWTEISAQAKRLLRDVHTLARAYGWREADILAMSGVRRQLKPGGAADSTRICVSRSHLPLAPLPNTTQVASNGFSAA